MKQKMNNYKKPLEIHNKNAKIKTNLNLKHLRLTKAGLHYGFYLVNKLFLQITALPAVLRKKNKISSKKCLLLYS